MKNAILAIGAVIIMITALIVPCFAANDNGLTASERWGVWVDYIDEFKDYEFNYTFAEQMVFNENNESWYSPVITTLTVNNQYSYNVNKDGLLRELDTRFYDKYNQAWEWEVGSKVFSAMHFVNNDGEDLYRGVMGRVIVEKYDPTTFYMWFYDDYNYNPNVARIRLRWRYHSAQGYFHEYYAYDQAVFVDDAGNVTTSSEWENKFALLVDCGLAVMEWNSGEQQINNAGCYIAGQLLSQGQNATNGQTHLVKWVDIQQLFGGYGIGHEFGYVDGYNAGVVDGYEEGMHQTKLKDFIIALFAAPGEMITGILDFDLLGINIATLVKTLLTIALVGAIILIIWKIAR